jgi:hypothetical protein
MQKIHAGIGHDVGRHGEWQQQRPVENGAPEKAVRRHQPGGADTEQGCYRADTDEQDGRVADRYRQNEPDEMRPQIA